MPPPEAPANQNAGDEAGTGITSVGPSAPVGAGLRPRRAEQSSAGSWSPTSGILRRLNLLLLIAACGAIRFAALAAKPFWFDECFSAEVARIGWRNFLHLLWWREANMSLYYLLLRMWVQFGRSEF